MGVIPSIVFSQWYVFKGDLGGKPITMYTLYTDVGIWGSYFFNDSKIPVLIENVGRIPATGNWKIYVNVNSKNPEEFNGNFDGNTFKGTWKSGKKNSNFNLKRDPTTEQLFETYSSYDKNKYNSFVISVAYPQKNHPHYSLLQNSVFEGDFQSFLKENIEKREKYYAAWNDILSVETAGNPPKDYFIIYPIYLSSKFVVYATYFYASLGIERGGYTFNTISISREQPVEIYDVLPEDVSKLKQVLADKLSKLFTISYTVDDISFDETAIYLTEDGSVFAFPAGPFYPGTLRISLTSKEAEPFLNQFARELWNN